MMSKNNYNERVLGGWQAVEPCWAIFSIVKFKGWYWTPVKAKELSVV